MAKKIQKRNEERAPKSSDEANGAPHPGHQMPAGYKKRGDLAGFWDPNQGPVHFIPKYAKAFDSKIEKLKPSVLIFGTSVGVNACMTKDQELVEVEAGELIGVWYKPGLKGLGDLAGVSCFCYLTGKEIDTGKGFPMKEYDVGSAKEGGVLYVTEDNRDKSRHADLPFPIFQTRQRGEEETPDHDGEEPEEPRF
jgi:hypothetical protein